MTRKYFGTDGVRGTVGIAPITPDFVMRLGYAAGTVLTGSESGSKPVVLIGKDTRISGYMLEAALEAGLSAAGVDVMLAGPMPTPAIAYLTRALRLSAGVVISMPIMASSFFRRRATSCQMPSNCRSRLHLNRRWGASHPTSWGAPSGWTMHGAAISNSARALSPASSTCAACGW
jgi:hypothetical protein